MRWNQRFGEIYCKVIIYRRVTGNILFVPEIKKCNFIALLNGWISCERGSLGNCFSFKSLLHDVSASPLISLLSSTIKFRILCNSFLFTGYYLKFTFHVTDNVFDWLQSKRETEWVCEWTSHLFSSFRWSFP